MCRILNCVISMEIVAFPTVSILTWFLERDCLSNILHEDTTLELQLILSVFSQRLHPVLLLIRIDFFAAKQYHLEKVDFVL